MNKQKKSKNLQKKMYDTLAYIFIWKEYNAKHFVAFCSFYKPECVFDSFANDRLIVHPESERGLWDDWASMP